MGYRHVAVPVSTSPPGPHVLSAAANTPMASTSADCATAQLGLRTPYVRQYTQGRAARVNQYSRGTARRALTPLPSPRRPYALRDRVRAGVGVAADA